MGDVVGGVRNRRDRVLTVPINLGHQLRILRHSVVNSALDRPPDRNRRAVTTRSRGEAGTEADMCYPAGHPGCLENRGLFERRGCPTLLILGRATKSPTGHHPRRASGRSWPVAGGGFGLGPSAPPKPAMDFGAKSGRCLGGFHRF